MSSNENEISTKIQRLISLCNKHSLDVILLFSVNSENTCIHFVVYFFFHTFPEKSRMFCLLFLIVFKSYNRDNIDTINTHDSNDIGYIYNNESLQTIVSLYYVLWPCILSNFIIIFEAIGSV